MTLDELKTLTVNIVANARLLSEKHTNQGEAPVNYACIFSQNKAEYDDMVALAGQLGPIADNTATGPVFEIPPLLTPGGELRLLKIRRPDPKRPERGDADFTVSDFETFKREHLSAAGFGLIQRPEMEMIELIDPSFDVLAYYSHPPLAEVLSKRHEQRTQGH